jgi:hypothetical protein
MANKPGKVIWKRDVKGEDASNNPSVVLVGVEKRAVTYTITEQIYRVVSNQEFVLNIIRRNGSRTALKAQDIYDAGLKYGMNPSSVRQTFYALLSDGTLKKLAGSGEVLAAY